MRSFCITATSCAVFTTATNWTVAQTPVRMCDISHRDHVGGLIVQDICTVAPDAAGTVSLQEPALT